MKNKIHQIFNKLFESIFEGLNWQGTVSGIAQHNITDHTIDEAKKYLKINYPFYRTYAVRRAEYGFRALSDPAEFSKSNAHVKGVDGAIDQLGLKENPLMSGSHQIKRGHDDTQLSKGIGYSWNVMENTSNGIAILYYQDRGMGSNEIIISSKNKNNLNGAISVFIDAGVIPDPNELKFKKAANAEKRNALIKSKGINIGKLFIDMGKEYKILSLLPSGKIKAQSTKDGEIITISPGSISKNSLK